MPPKVILVAVVPAAIITLGPLGIQGNTNIAKTSKQLIEQYREMIT